MRHLTLTFFFVYLTVQIALPTYRLFQPLPSRFSWQMFSASSLPTRVWLVSDSGEKEIPATLFIGNYRADLEWERYAPAFICQQNGAQAVRYMMPLEKSPHEFRCRVLLPYE